MLQNWEALEDPYIQDCVSKFLERYERAMNQLDGLHEFLETDPERLALSERNPELAKMYEGKTKAQLEETKPLMATVVGVAFVLRFVLKGV